MTAEKKQPTLRKRTNRIAILVYALPEEREALVEAVAQEKQQGSSSLSSFLLRGGLQRAAAMGIEKAVALNPAT